MLITEHQHNVFYKPTLKICHLLHQLKSPSNSKACYILEHTTEIHSWGNELGSLMQFFFSEQRIVIKAWRFPCIPQTLKQWGGRGRRLWKNSAENIQFLLLFLRENNGILWFVWVHGTCWYCSIKVPYRSKKDEKTKMLPMQGMHTDFFMSTRIYHQRDVVEYDVSCWRNTCGKNVTS